MPRIFGRSLAVLFSVLCLSAGVAQAVVASSGSSKGPERRNFDLREQYAHAADGPTSLVQASAIERLAAKGTVFVAAV